MEQRRSVVEAVANLLQRWRLEQHIRVGDRFPSERELARRLKVSRATIREALVLLKERGVVAIRQGDGIRSNAIADGGSVRWLPHLFHHARDRQTELRLLIAFFELRTVVLAEVFSLVAMRAETPDLARAGRALEGVALASRYAQQWFEAVREERDAEDLFLEIADNEALQLNVTGLWEFLARTPEVSRHLRLRGRLADARCERLADALRSRDPDQAREAARSVYCVTHAIALARFEAQPFRPRPADEFADEIGASPTRSSRLGASPLDRETEFYDPFDR